jgi:ADP-ribose pyrophosphatase YjhB (NUDIX family)
MAKHESAPTPDHARFPEDEAGHVEFIARGVAILDGRVLLCQSKKRGYYYLPGGHVDFGEPGEAALKREIQEEMGLPSTVGPLLQVHECAFHDGKVRRHEVNLVFHVEHVGAAGAPMPDPPPSAEKHIAFAWLPLATILSQDVRPARARQWLHDHARVLAAGQLPPFSFASDF